MCVKTTKHVHTLYALINTFLTIEQQKGRKKNQQQQIYSIR